MSGEEKPARLDDAAFAALLRVRIEHEDNLIVSRTSWLMASESFLYTAYAIALNGITTPGMSNVEHQARLLKLIPLVGIACSLLILTGILAAIRAMAWLRKLYRTRLPDDATVGLAPIQTPIPNVAAGLAAPVLLPTVFVIVWLYLLSTERF
ncbi:MAG: hypothetical protein EHM91_11130 [Planctomycetota bacterium]|nr:MAG: hypothetical protein EHM91_11130 [Planctomycetota bacterium]